MKKINCIIVALMFVVCAASLYGQVETTVLSVSSSHVTNIQWFKYDTTAQDFLPVVADTNVLLVTNEEGIYYASFDKDGCRQATSYVQIKCSDRLASEPVTITAGTIASPSYTWLRDGMVLAGENNPTLEANEPGIYQAIKQRVGCPADTLSYVLLDVRCCDSLALTVLLEGPYNASTDLMTTSFNYFHLLPGQDPTLSEDIASMIQGVAGAPGQPYGGAPWNYNGTEGDLYGDSTVITSPDRVAYDSTVVDWILVSLRSSVSPASEFYQCAMLLHNDGRVQVPEDCDCLKLEQGNSYRIVIQHRNHIPVMSDEVTYTDFPLTYDFTASPGYVSGFGSPQEVAQVLVDGRYMLFGGNSEQVSVAGRTDINVNDYSAGTVPRIGVVRRYIPDDNDMNGDVNSGDISNFIEKNFGIVTFIF